MNEGLIGSDQGQRPIAILTIAFLLTCCALITWSLSASMNQFILAGVLIFVLFQLAIIAPMIAIVSVFTYLTCIGDLRRIMLYWVGSTPFDPLLIVAPIIAGALLIVPIFMGRLNNAHPLGRWMSIFLLMMGLEILNPKQGSLAVGAGGAFFYIVPLMWYWIGQAYGSRRLLTIMVYRLLVPLAILAATYGAIQQFIDFPEFQLSWLRQQIITMNVVSEKSRPFGWFISPAEYAVYLSVASLALLAATPKHKWLAIPALFLVSSCILTGSRGPIVAIFLSIAVMWAVSQHRLSFAASVTRAVVMILLCLGGFAYLLFFARNTDINANVNPYIERQAQGFLTPQQSTAVDHSQLFTTGILASLTTPIGSGLGYTTIAAGKLGSVGQGTEIDISNIFLSLGPAGGLVYLYIIVLIFKTAVRVIRQKPEGSCEELAVLGILVGTLGQWLTGALYSVVMIVWLCVGALDRLDLESSRRQSL